MGGGWGKDMLLSLLRQGTVPSGSAMFSLPQRDLCLLAERRHMLPSHV